MTAKSINKSLNTSIILKNVQLKALKDKDLNT
jgi:hypothetical protein